MKNFHNWPSVLVYKGLKVFATDSATDETGIVLNEVADSKISSPVHLVCLVVQGFRDYHLVPRRQNDGHGLRPLKVDDRCLFFYISTCTANQVQEMLKVEC